VLIAFTDVQSSGVLGVKLLGTWPRWAMVHIQVQGPNTLRISNALNDLTTLGPSGALQGLQLTSGSTGGVVSLWWIGPMYGIASAPGTLVEVISLGGTGADDCGCQVR
jgi:hypothetical protein